MATISLVGHFHFSIIPILQVATANAPETLAQGPWCGFGEQETEHVVNLPTHGSPG